MVNLKAAAQTIRAELDHAKQGLAFYQSRVDTLSIALEQIEVAGGTTTPLVKSYRKSSPAATESGLPVTGADFWIRFVGKRPQPAALIALKAARFLKLDIKKDAIKVKKLKSRVSPAMEALLKSSRIESSGTGRDRRFFIA